MTDMDIDAYKYALSQPGAVTAALNYYRNAAALYVEDDWLKDGHVRVTSPTLIVWVRCIKFSCFLPWVWVLTLAVAGLKTQCNGTTALSLARSAVLYVLKDELM